MQRPGWSGGRWSDASGEPVCSEGSKGWVAQPASGCGTNLPLSLVFLSPVCEMDPTLGQISSGKKAGGHYDRNEKWISTSLPLVSQTLTHHHTPLPLPGWQCFNTVLTVFNPVHVSTLSVILFCPGQKHWLAVKRPAGWKTLIAYLRNTCLPCHATSSE